MLEIHRLKVRFHELGDLFSLLALVGGLQFPCATVDEDFLEGEGCLDLIVVPHVTIDRPPLTVNKIVDRQELDAAVLRGQERTDDLAVNDHTLRFDSKGSPRPTI